MTRGAGDGDDSAEPLLPSVRMRVAPRLACMLPHQPAALYTAYEFMLQVSLSCVHECRRCAAAGHLQYETRWS